MRICCLLFILLLISPGVNAQLGGFGQNLKKGLSDFGAKEKAKMEESGQAKMDYTDFQFAFSVNDNTGFFDIDQRGETLVKGMSLLKDNSEKTPVENARDSLDMGLFYYNGRKYALSEGFFAQAKRIAETNNLREHIIYLRIISSMGLVALTQGKTNDAATYIDQALELALKTQTKNSPAYIANLNNNTKLIQSLGKYNEAEKAFDEAIGLATDIFGATSEQYSVLLNNKAMLFQSMGRYDEGIELLKSAIAISDANQKRPKQEGKSFESRRFQANLAFLYQQSGRLPEAETTFLTIKKIFENRLQTGNLEYANLLNQMALLYIQMGKKDEVKDYLTKAADIYKRVSGEESAYYAKPIADLGNFYRMESRYAEAEPLILQALEIRKRALGEAHPDLVSSQEDLAILYWKMSQWDKAYPVYKEVMDKSIDFINNYFPPMSEAEKTKYWDKTNPRFQRFYNFAIDGSAVNKSLIADLYDYQAATKALLLNSTNKIKQAILKSGNTTLINDYLAWIGQKELLARYYSLSKEELNDQHINLDSLNGVANRMEKSLSERSVDFSSGYAAQKVDYKKVAGVLLDPEAVVEIIRVRGFDQDFTPKVRYAALILKKGITLPQLVVLENGEELESRYLKYYRNTVQQRVVDEFSYGQFWQKIEPALTGKKTIYLSSDGVYNQINLNTLKRPSGNYVVNQFDLVLLGNSKDLIELKARKASVAAKTAVLIGFPDYGTTEVAALPGTKTEMDNISKILRPAGYKVTQFSAATASEANLKSVKRPELLHIATHGYFLKDLESGSSFGVNAENVGNNPLLRSGLLLAGVGNTLDNHSTDLESNDNGVLTAYEAMNLDLTGTELVILSACETGLGDVKAGEGVYGLQRAFQVAGAHALIMSLWKVDDEATQYLMTSFYTNWIKLHDKAKAFRQAQLQLIAKYKDPFFWGAFVMMGN